MKLKLSKSNNFGIPFPSISRKYRGTTTEENGGHNPQKTLDESRIKGRGPENWSSSGNDGTEVSEVIIPQVAGPVFEFTKLCDRN